MAASTAEANEAQTTSSTTALRNLIDELERIGKTVTASTSTSAFSEEGLEMLRTRTASTSTAGLAALAPLALTPMQAASASEVVVKLAYTGASFGLGHERYDFELPDRLQEALGDQGRIESVEPNHAILVQGVSILIASDRRVKTLVDFLSDGRIECGLPEEAASIRTHSERMLVRIGEEWRPAGSLGPGLDDLAPPDAYREYELRICRDMAGHQAMLYSPATARQFMPPHWRIGDFEFRRGLSVVFSREGKRQSLDIVGIPFNEAARRFHLLELTMKQDDKLLYVDAGSFVDGSTRLDSAEVSLHRPLGFEMLARLRPAALVPGQTELTLGAKQFIEEARLAKLEYVATNWTSKDPRYNLPKSILRDIETPGGTVKVAFLGALDPVLSARSTQIGLDGVTIDEPIAAIRKEVRSLNRKAERPHLVVLLTTASPALVATMRQTLRGVDLIMGDTIAATHRSRGLRIELGPDTGRERLPAGVLPLSSLNIARMKLVKRGGRWTLRSVEVTFERTIEHLKPDARVMEVLSRRRAEVYPGLDRQVLRPKSGGPLERLSDAEWARVVCEAVRRYTGADVVLLPDLPHAERAPGALTELLIADRLAIGDQIDIDRLRGEDLSSVLEDAPPAIATACGGQMRVGSPKVLGRAVSDDRMYEIATTDRALLLGLSESLSSKHGHHLFEHGPELLTDESGHRVTLRRAVLSVLRDLAKRDRSRVAPVEPFLEESAQVAGPEWSLVLERLAFQLERFTAANDQAFSQVSDTLVTSPSSLNLGFSGDAAVLYDSTSFLADFRVRSRYRTIGVTGSPDKELEDDLRFSSSASLPGVTMKTGPLAWMPFLEGVFDTEITPVADPMPLPRRADLSATLGVSTSSFLVDRLRVGAIALRDLSSRAEHPTKIGARLEAKVGGDLGRGVRLSGLADVSYFGYATEAVASDLRLKAYFEGRLELPVARLVNIAAYSRALVFEGQVPEARHVAASYVWGLAFELHGAFPL